MNAAACRACSLFWALLLIQPLSAQPWCAAPGPAPAAVDELTLSIYPDGAPVEVGPDGGRIRYTVGAVNRGDRVRRYLFWIEVTDPRGVVRRRLGPKPRRLRPGEGPSRRFGLRVPPRARAGVYEVTFHAAPYPGAALASASFTFEKLPGAAKAGAEVDAAAGAGWDGTWFGDDGTWFGDEGPEAAAELPHEAVVLGVHPNPFHARTRIAFALPEAAPVRLRVYDALGREVARLVDGVLAAGSHEVIFEAGRLGRGVYLYRLDVAGRAERGTLLLMK